MFKLLKTGGPFGDETSNYKVIFDKKYTVKEFIDAVLANRSGEWGDIMVNDKRKYDTGFPCAEYKHGKLEGKYTIGPYENYYVKAAYVNGGGSYMSYDLVLED